MNARRRILVAIAALALAALTIGAGMAVADDGDDDGGTRVTSSGRVAVPSGATGASRRLLLTRVTVSGQCERVVPPPQFSVPPTALARAVVEAESGKTLDAFAPGSGPSGPGTIAGSSLVTPPFAFGTVGGISRPAGSTTLIVTSNGATATITMGGGIDLATGDCTFVWQAIESRNR